MSEDRGQRPVTALRGVGEALAARLAALGVHRVQDLLAEYGATLRHERSESGGASFVVLFPGGRA